MAKIYGRFSGREFNPAQAGGLLRKLSTHGVKITNRGIDSVVQHVSRFGPDAANEYMIKRLRDIVTGKIPVTQVDLNFYTHELREFVRYRHLGWKNKQPDDAEFAYELWNNTHTATLEEYQLSEQLDDLYHPKAIQLMGEF